MSPGAAEVKPTGAALTSAPSADVAAVAAEDSLSKPSLSSVPLAVSTPSPSVKARRASRRALFANSREMSQLQVKQVQFADPSSDAASGGEDEGFEAEAELVIPAEKLDRFNRIQALRAKSKSVEDRVAFQLLIFAF